MNESSSSDSDRDLLRKVRHGDPAAFHQMVDRFAPQLFALARTMLGNTADAEDAVQETLAGAFKGLAAYRGEASLRTWLVQILVRQVARQRRTSLRGRVISLDPGQRREVGEPVTESNEQQVDSRLDVAAMVQKLSAEHREVLVLRELEGMSYEQMARAIGVPVGTVESRLHRARQELRERFGKDFYGAAR